MERITITAQMRETGKGPSRRMRTAGNIPAVLYGKSIDPQPIFVNAHELEKISKKGSNQASLVDIKLGDKSFTALIRDYQADPFKRMLSHMDFQAVTLDETIEMEVPIKLIGNPAGIKEGGILEQLRRTVSVRCAVDKIPAHIDVDVTELQIGDNIHVGDLQSIEGVEINRATNFAIAAVVPPTKEEVPAVAAVVEGAEVAEGAEAPAAETQAEEKPAEAKGEKKE